MIKRGTVFILGAGASYPYKFPLGNELSSLIIKKTTQITNISELKQLQILPGTLHKFREDFEESGTYTIDEFLQANSNYLSVGKKLIASVLLPFEHKKYLYNRDIGDDWYRYLINKMVYNQIGDISQNNVKFITFNYDRSLEYYLFNSLSRRFNANENQVKSQLEKIDIIHVHGQLGYLPWQHQNPNNVVDFIGSHNMRDINVASEHIRIIHEDDELEILNNVSKVLTEATRIVFLGFGFHKFNLEKLDIQNWKTREVFGTALGKTKIEISKISETTNERIKNFNLFDSHIVNMFRELLPID